jgi:4-hydroxybenzoate polyprenyltransferase
MPITFDTIKLLRIPFSFFLMPVFLLAVSQLVPHIDFSRTIIVFAIIHLLVYPSSNGYNSYIDQDEGSIGGLEKPPKPTQDLLYLTIAFDALAIILSLAFVNQWFALMVTLYILASRAYSNKQIRLKKYAIVGFLVVVFFQGAFTFAMVYTGLKGEWIPVLSHYKFILLACSLQIAGAYPLTQIYQHEADLKDGVTTLSYRLGYKGTFIFTATMFLCCNVCYLLYFFQKVEIGQFLVLQLFFLPVVSYFGYWFYQVTKNTDNADFKHTMLMNWVSSVSMNLCFIYMIIMNSNT